MVSWRTACCSNFYETKVGHAAAPQCGFDGHSSANSNCSAAQSWLTTDTTRMTIENDPPSCLGVVKQQMFKPCKLSSSNISLFPGCSMFVGICANSATICSCLFPHIHTVQIDDIGCRPVKFGREVFWGQAPFTGKTWSRDFVRPTQTCRSQTMIAQHNMLFTSRSNFFSAASWSLSWAKMMEQDMED